MPTSAPDPFAASDQPTPRRRWWDLLAETAYLDDPSYWTVMSLSPHGADQPVDAFGSEADECLLDAWLVTGMTVAFVAICLAPVLL